MTDDLFQTFERIETCRRVEVREDNIHLLAQHFECAVDYSGAKPVMPKTDKYNHAVEIGSWVDERRSRWNPEPLTQGWHPEGTYTKESK